MHLQVFLRDHLFADFKALLVLMLGAHLGQSLPEDAVHTTQFEIDLAFEKHVLEHVVEDLFDDHDDGGVSEEFAVILMVEDVDQVRDVDVYELEHVSLIDHGVFQSRDELMILIRHQTVRQSRIYLTEDADQEYVD